VSVRIPTANAAGGGASDLGVRWARTGCGRGAGRRPATRLTAAAIMAPSEPMPEISGTQRMYTAKKSRSSGVRYRDGERTMSASRLAGWPAPGKR